MTGTLNSARLTICEQFLTSLHSHRRAIFAVKDVVLEPGALVTSRIFSEVVLLCAFALVFVLWRYLYHGILIGQGGEVYLAAFHRLSCCLGWTAGRN